MSGIDPAGKIIRPDGTDVSNRDRSDDGAIILRRGVEKGHTYKFGRWPTMPWKLLECPKCLGQGTTSIQRMITKDMAIDAGEPEMEGQPIPEEIDCDLCDGECEVMAWRATRWLKWQ